CDLYSLYVQLSHCRTLDSIILVSKARERDLARLELLSRETVEKAQSWLDE
ncbi:hypothetical protein B0J13DRAFT_575797, partial [Dactylonectria estremocensis]